MNCQVSGTARVVADPEIRTTPNGKLLSEVRLAISNSTRRQDGSYKDSPAIWATATLWGQMAENAAEVLRRGDEVIFAGQLEKEEFDKKDGTKGEKLVIKFAEIAPSIRRGAVVTREQANPPAAPRSDNRTAQRPPAARPQASAPPVDDPWAAPAPASFVGAGADEPPF